MSKADTETTAKKMSKDVQIVAYLKADADADRVEVMDSLDDGHDYTETEVTHYDYYRMVFGGGEERISEEQYDFLKSKDPAGIRLIHYVQEEENTVQGGYQFRTGLRNDAIRNVTLEMPGSDMRSRFRRKVQIDDRSVFKVSMDGPDKMRKLKHQSEVEDGEMFEDDDTEYWTVTMRCEVDGLKPSLYRWFDETVVPDLMTEVAKHDWVQQTRVMDCEKEYSESGVCFDL